MYDSESSSEAGWIDWFCDLEGHEFFVSVSINKQQGITIISPEYDKSVYKAPLLMESSVAKWLLYDKIYDDLKCLSIDRSRIHKGQLQFVWVEGTHSKV